MATATRDDLMRDELFQSIKSVLTWHAYRETCKKNSQTVRHSGRTVNHDDVEPNIGDMDREAMQDVMLSLLFLAGADCGSFQGDSAETLAFKTLILIKNLKGFLAENKLMVTRDLAHQVILRLVGHGACIPGSSGLGASNGSYETLGISKQAFLLDCFKMLSKISYSNRDWFQALLWFEEFQVLSGAIKLTRNATPKQNWKVYQSMDPLYITHMIEGLSTSSNLLEILQNTGFYHHLTVMSERYIRLLPPDGASSDKDPIPDKAKLLKERKQHFESLRHLRHPDPRTCFKYVLIDPRLQVSGAWKRLPVKPNESMRRRSLSEAFIWKGYLYIAGGVTRSDSQGRVSSAQDIWRLRLDSPCEWQLFSNLPLLSSMYDRSRYSGVNLKIYEDKGYLFTGDPTLNILDLKTGKWTKLRTTYVPTAADRMAGTDAEWPWGCSGNNYVTGAAQQIIGDRLLVFGGIHGKCLNGCNLLMELNLKTMRWRRLNGYTRPQKELSLNMPGPRYNPASWAENGKLFVLYGICERIKPDLGLLNNVGPSEQWVWDDMWSWDVKREEWRRERIAGNPPAPRCEMGHAYNEKLGKVFIFGGINPTCPYQVTRTNEFLASEATYADTFILSTSGELDVQVPFKSVVDKPDALSNRQPGPYSWKQVMTCGFPTYRAGSALACDPDTGKIYMYGGRVRADFVPNKNHTEIQAAKRGKEALRRKRQNLGVAEAITQVPYRYFGHVWQLHVDISDGHFECINKEDEIRTASPGPWNRCFECGKADFWKKCGGTCGGRAHFCSKDCQTKGWELHKQMHGCKKS